MLKIQKLLGCLALAAATVTGAYAQNYPTKPIYLYIPFAAGGPTDTLGRNLAQVMGRRSEEHTSELQSHGPSRMPSSA